MSGIALIVVVAAWVVADEIRRRKRRKMIDGFAARVSKSTPPEGESRCSGN